MVCPVSRYTESRKRALVSGVGYTAVRGTKANNLRTSVAALLLYLAANLLVLDLRGALEISHHCIRIQAAEGA